MFGQIGGRPLLERLIKRWNSDFKTSPNAPVRLWVESGELPPERIRVCVDGRAVNDPLELCALAEDVCAQWGRKTKGATAPIVFAPPLAVDAPAGVSLNVKENRVLIELVLDRPFESFGPEDEEQLLRTIRALLKTGRELPIKGKRPGSVILTLELTEDEARELAAVVAAGALAEFGASTVRAALVQKVECKQNEIDLARRAHTESERTLPTVSVHGGALPAFARRFSPFGYAVATSGHVP